MLTRSRTMVRRRPRVR